ncbi:MAG: hypothetical protein IPJ19_16565 [Planctomycetes bacterium]|nr:hypothetical protein [Planctomycetota bacterium]
MKFAMLAGAGLALVAAIVVIGHRGSDVGDRRLDQLGAQALDVSEQPAPTVVQGAGRGDSDPGSWAVAVAPTFSQPVFTQGIARGLAPTSLVLENREKDPATGKWELSKYDFSTSYEIDSVCSRQAYEFYVAGHYPLSSPAGGVAGQTVIEKWTHSPVTGAYFCNRATASTPIGQPVAGIPAVTTGINGGTYIPAAQRPRPGRQTRTVVYSGPTLGIVKAMACDPEGRFLFLVVSSGAQGLYELPLQPIGSPSPIYSPSTLPFISDCRSITPRQHVQNSRIYVLMPDGGAHSGSRELLFDHDNDGIIDTVQELTRQQYNAGGYRGTSASWLTDFVTF